MILSLIAWPTPPTFGGSPRSIGRDEIDRAAADRVRRPVVGDRLERDLALDLEDVADLVEDPGEVAVGQVGRLVGEDVGRRLVGIVVARLGPAAAGRRSRPRPRGASGDGGAVGDGRSLGIAAMVARGPCGSVAERGRSRELRRRRPGRDRRAWRRRARDRPARSSSSIGSSGSSATAAPTDTLTAADAEPRAGRARPTASRTRSPTSTATSMRRVAEQDGELLAAVAGRHVILANRADDGRRDRAQDLVADRVAVRVVEHLEPVDVDHQHADAVLGPPAPGEEGAELVEVAPVREAGQAVRRGAGLRLTMRVGPRQGGRRLDRRADEEPLGGRRPGAGGPARDQTSAPIIPSSLVSGATSVCRRPKMARARRGDPLGDEPVRIDLAQATGEARDGRGGTDGAGAAVASGRAAQTRGRDAGAIRRPLRRAPRSRPDRRARRRAAERRRRRSRTGSAKTPPPSISIGIATGSRPSPIVEIGRVLEIADREERRGRRSRRSGR